MEELKKEIIGNVTFWLNENMGNRTNKMLADVLLNTIDHIFKENEKKEIKKNDSIG